MRRALTREARAATDRDADHALELEQLAHRLAYLDRVGQLTQADHDKARDGVVKNGGRGLRYP